MKPFSFIKEYLGRMFGIKYHIENDPRSFYKRYSIIIFYGLRYREFYWFK